MLHEEADSEDGPNSDKDNRKTGKYQDDENLLVHLWEESLIL